MPPHAPPLSPDRLLRVLGLSGAAEPGTVRARGIRLLAHLERRRETVQGAERRAVEQEIDGLWQALARWPAPEGDRAASPRRGRGPRGPMRRSVLGLAAAIVALGLAAGALHWVAGRMAGGLGAGGLAGGADAAEDDAPSGRGRLVVQSDPADALLRVHPTGSAEVLHEGRARRARVDLAPGRYTLEVSRADCPEAWSETVALEAGETRRFAPRLCRGRARLVVRSNVRDDRLRIDGYDRGATGPEPHAVRVGDHTVRVDKEGFAPFEAQVRLAPDEQVELHAELTPLDAPTSRTRPLPVERRMPTPPPSAPPSVTEQAPPPAPGSAAPPGGAAAGGGSEGTSPADTLAPPSGLLWSADGAPVRARGGSTSWHDAVARELVSRFDRDGSGSIDRVAESEAISCPLWRDIEREFEEGGLGLSMSHNYGFDGSEWIDGALGFSREIRSAAYARMQECGLRP